MRCRVDDLAVTERLAIKDNNGRFVTIVRRDTDSQDGWVVKSHGPLRTAERLAPAGSHVIIGDSHLRPIRDNNRPDETLAWAGDPLQRDVKRLNDQMDDALKRLNAEVARAMGLK